MAHFSLIVLGDEVETQLEKFNKQTENNKYLEFVDVEDYFFNIYENEGISTLRVKKNNHYYETDYSDGDVVSLGNNSYKYPDVPDNGVIVSYSYKDKYKSFEEFMKTVNDYPKRDNTKNRYGYWTNINGKFGYCNIGGRWSNFFKLKPGCKAIEYDPSLNSFFANEQKEGYANSAKIKDIDFNFMKNFICEEYTKVYDKLEEVLKGQDLPSLKKYIESHNGDATKAYHEYRNNPLVKELSRAGFFATEGHAERFGANREEFLRKKYAELLVPFAIIKDGKWYELGKLGWWGNDDFNDNDWSNKFLELINEVDPETRLTIVDYSH